MATEKDPFGLSRGGQAKLTEEGKQTALQQLASSNADSPAARMARAYQASKSSAGSAQQRDAGG